jgi:hypothetical protein
VTKLADADGTPSAAPTTTASAPAVEDPVAKTTGNGAAEATENMGG